MADEFDPKHDYEEMGNTNEEEVSSGADDDEFEDIDDAEEEEGELES